ncbi:hypothetical protein [Spirosoma endbachense]|uniref:Uncharacterized protein n=1 Tax=Spirosoma endbachense TaxID=2666025 RepID=A0A6P1W0F1_9BACT|nr:hypothetical protein [Spirosoma endbachense]QHV97459.1 hypothetical protein GJR95_21725 [Spirosoma endbachense]
MSYFLRLSLICCLIALISAPALSQSTHTVAKPNETVWVIAYPVKANKRAQYERFIHEIFWPGAKNLSAAEQKIFKQTRVMHPTKPEPDGSYAYLFIMDPVIKGADYGIESLLKKEYGEPKAKEYFKLFKDAIIEKNYKDYRLIQSKD